MQLKQKYQMSDWRRRPLSPEMLLYARSDTHFLLPIQAVMAEELRRAGGAQVEHQARVRGCDPRVPNWLRFHAAPHDRR